MSDVVVRRARGADAPVIAYLNRVTDRSDTVDVPTHRYVKPVG
ncbi:hypothetical protein [Nocardia arthritidis]|nr:hypothetical protein [Nocardia arthritidis]